MHACMRAPLKRAAYPPVLSPVIAHYHPRRSSNVGPHRQVIAQRLAADVRNMRWFDY